MPSKRALALIREQEEAERLDVLSQLEVKLDLILDHLNIDQPSWVNQEVIEHEDEDEDTEPDENEGEDVSDEEEAKDEESTDEDS